PLPSLFPSTTLFRSPNLVDIPPPTTEGPRVDHEVCAPQFLWIGQFGDHKNVNDALKIFGRAHKSLSVPEASRLHLVFSREWTKRSEEHTSELQSREN